MGWASFVSETEGISQWRSTQSEPHAPDPTASSVPGGVARTHAVLPYCTSPSSSTIEPEVQKVAAAAAEDDDDEEEEGDEGFYRRRG